VNLQGIRVKAADFGPAVCRATCMESAGNWPPDGMDMHVLFGDEGDMRVSEIWDSEEQFRAFADRLMPVLDEVGVSYSEPEVFEAHELQKRPQGATA
jgi:hypothetical protein